MKRSLLSFFILAAACLGLAPGAFAGDADVTDPIAFGSVDVGESSAPMNLTITRTAGSVQLGTPAATLSDAVNYSIDTSDCDGENLNGGNLTCTMAVTFNPTVSGLINATVSFNTTNASIFTPTTTSLSGTGVDQPVPSVSPLSIDFGQVEVNTTAGPETVTVENIGTIDLDIGTAALSGADAPVYSIDADGCSGTMLPAGNTCTIDISFTPDAVATFNDANLDIPFNNGNTPQVSVDLDGEGVNFPAVDASPDPLDFGIVLVSEVPATRTITVTNTGLADLNVTDVALNDGTDFSIPTEDCTAGPVAPSMTCTIDVQLDTAIVGMYSDTVEITSDAPSSVDMVDVSAEVQADQPAVDLSPTSVDFGMVVDGDTSGISTVTVTNTGTADLNVSVVALSGADDTNFAIDSENCTAGPVTPASACTIDLTFSPDAVRAFAASLDITSDAATSVDMVPLSGEGVSTPAPAVGLSPTSLNFGNQGEGTTSLPSAITVTNTGIADLNISAVALSGADGSNFAVSSQNCTGGAVTPGNNCTINLTFSPDAIRAFAASLDITSDAASSPDSVPLSGTGVSVATPVVSLSPTSLAFGNVSQGSTSQLTLTIENSGNPDLLIGTLSIGGVDEDQYSIVADTCSGTVVVSQGTCSVTVEFEPNALRAFVAALGIPSNAPTSPDSVPLSGTGVQAPPPPPDGGCSLNAVGGASPMTWGLGLLLLGGVFATWRRRS